MGDEDEEIPKYVPGASQVLNSLKELQRKEEYFFMKASQKRFIELEKKLKEKNTYFGKAKIPDVYEYDLQKQREKDLAKIRNPHTIEKEYCQKCPVYKNHCPHKNPKTQIRDKYSYPLISSSTYGWLPEYDLFKSNFRKNNATKDFYSSSHLTVG